MSAFLTAIPILKSFVKYLTAPELLKEKEKEIERLRKEVKKLTASNTRIKKLLK